MKLIMQLDVEGIDPASEDPQDLAHELTDPFGPVRRDISVSVEKAQWEEVV